MFDDESNSDDEWIPEMLQPRRRRPRLFRIRTNFDLPPSDNRSRFRLENRHVDAILEQVGPLIAHDTNRNYALSPEQQIRTSLRYLASGAIYSSAGDSHNIHKSTVSRTLHRFVDAVNAHVYPEVVKWPRNVDVMRGIIEKFREKANFPAVVGCVDGTYVNIIRPSINEHQYVNRHQDHAINAMFVAGPNLEFFYVSTKWPGSVNDGRVFRLSTLRTRLEQGWRPYPMAVLLGDSAYTNTNYLIAPLRMPATAQEERFNRAQRRTRRLVECAFGLMKQRFRCLFTTMPFKPAFAADIIRCCATLHNIVIDAADMQEALAVFANGDDEDLIDPNLDRENDSDEENDDDHDRRTQLVRLF
jgi:nuclease HARBI1